MEDIPQFVNHIKNNDVLPKPSKEDWEISFLRGEVDRLNAHILALEHILDARFSYECKLESELSSRKGKQEAVLNDFFDWHIQKTLTENAEKNPYNKWAECLAKAIQEKKICVE